MDACVYCKIIAQEIPSSLIYQDDKVLAFLDIRPITQGHALLIPKVHSPSIASLDASILPALFKAASKITRGLYEALACDGVNWHTADGEDAGQEVFHFHLHLIPRYKGDGFGLRLPAGYGEPPSRSKLDSTAAKLRANLEDR